MFAYTNPAARPGWSPAARFFMGLSLIAVLALAPRGAGALPPAGASGPQGAAQASKLSPGKAGSGKSVSKKTGKPKRKPGPKPAAKHGSKPGARVAAKPAAKLAAPEGPGQKDGALKTFPVCNVPALAPAEAAKLPVADTWQPLAARLSRDGVDGAYLRAMFGRLGNTYSHVPMGTKINELFFVKYMPKPARPAATPGGSDTPPVYKWALKPESVLRCKEYLERHKDAFAAMEKEYGIPKEIVAGLLMVETRLGAYLGTSSSFWSLACLAAADTPDRVAPTLQALPLPMTPDKMEWVSKLVRERSAWAYKELLALVQHCQKNGLDPLLMPGSVYGAVGICQFMPSNLPRFAVDGNKDGKIDLFEPADAIPSVGNYLKKHGWQNGTREARHQVIKKYNKSDVYANTILALAEAMAHPEAERLASADGGEKAASTKPAAGKVRKAAQPAGAKNGAGKTARKKTPAGKTSSGQNAPSPAAGKNSR